MIFFTLHHALLAAVPQLYEQTHNLTTFLLGVIAWVFLYTFLFNQHITATTPFPVLALRYGFGMILTADCFAIGIIYKDYYHRSILTQVEEVLGAGPVVTDHGSSVSTLNFQRDSPQPTEAPSGKPKDA